VDTADASFVVRAIEGCDVGQQDNGEEGGEIQID